MLRLQRYENVSKKPNYFLLFRWKDSCIFAFVGVGEGWKEVNFSETCMK